MAAAFFVCCGVLAKNFDPLMNFYVITLENFHNVAYNGKANIIHQLNSK